jgi:isopentenyldiphosphate isomerase
MEEQIDILNEQGEKTGESRTKTDVHKLGLWHRTIHVWFINSKGEFLLQKRSKNMEAYPGYWYNSVSGHISAGQSSLEAAQRETHEELGVLLPEDNFKYLFSVRKQEVLNGGMYLNNEFNDVYLVHSDLALSEFKIQTEEVDEIKFVSLEEFKKWILGKGELFVPDTEEHKKLLEFLAK